jgi:2-dehydropantoate 2-reductase
LLGPETTVAFVGNGIPWWYFHGEGSAREGQRLDRLDPGGLAWDRIGPGRVVGGVINTPCEVVEPGVVRVASLAGGYELTLGEPRGGATPRLRALVDAFGEGALKVTGSDRIRQQIWSKLVLNICSGPLAALTGSRLQDLFSSAACADARRRMHREAQELAAAMGCPVQLDVEVALDSARRSGHRASMAQDMVLHRPLELDAICMVPLELARMKEVATPTLDLMIELTRLRAVEEGLYPATAA